MADYISTLTGVQIDSALLDMAEHNSEAWAVGERNGITVGSDDVTYQNNARYYAQQAQSIAPASVTEAVRWDVAQTALTDANKEMARANIDAGKNGAWTNPNLLDNWCFINPVNQRGWTSGIANNVYTIDRWKTSSSSSYTVAVNSGYITVTGLFYQKVERKFRTDTPLTISYMLTDGTITQKTGVIGSSEGYAVGNAAFGFYYRPSTGIGDFQIQCTAYNIVACKLEYGSVSTLANDTPPDYGTELLKCQRYFFRINGGYHPFGVGDAVTTTLVRIFVPTPVPMRVLSAVNVTVTMHGSVTMRPHGSSGVSATAVACDSINSNGVGLSFTIGTAITQYSIVLGVLAGSNNPIDISCDL